MDLATHQRALLGLLRAPEPPRDDADPYLQQLARSPDLAEARGNIALWRLYVLERSCVLTVELLRQRGDFATVLDGFIRTHNLSPFREFQPRAFLAHLATHADALVVAVSQFERGLLQLREGGPDPSPVPWPVDPHPVLRALATAEPLPAARPASPHLIRLSGALPRGFTIEPA